MFYYGQRSKCADLLNSYFRVYIISNVLIYSKRLLCVLIKNFGTPAHHESNKNAVCRFSTPLPEKSELKIRHHSSVLFYPQNRLYPTIISAAAVRTRKKVVGSTMAQVIPKPTQNSMRPHNRFIPVLLNQVSMKDYAVYAEIRHFFTSGF